MPLFAHDCCIRSDNMQSCYIPIEITVGRSTQPNRHLMITLQSLFVILLILLLCYLVFDDLLARMVWLLLVGPDAWSYT